MKTRNENYTKLRAANLLNIPVSRLDSIIFQHHLVLQNGKIKGEDFQKMADEISTYIGWAEYLKPYKNGRFDPEHSQDRYHAYDYLCEHLTSEHDIQILLYTDLMTGTRYEKYYFKRSQIDVVDDVMHSYLMTVGLSGKEIVDQYIKTCKHKHTVKILKQYIDERMYGKPMNKVFCEFARIILFDIPDIKEATEEDLSPVLHRQLASGTLDLIYDFLDFASARTTVQYPLHKQTKKNGSMARPAYDYETYLVIAACCFNEEHIVEHDMVAKALNDHFQAEMWLYVSLLFMCGWRAQDICRGWIYLHLADGTREDFPGVNLDTLYEDLLEDRIPEETYAAVAKFLTGKITAANFLPSKTSAMHPTTLTIFIVPELYVFFGRLALIAEADMMRYHDGYMRPERVHEYQNKANLLPFFGDEMAEALQGMNLESRRMNKAFLQNIEYETRKEGAGSIMASAVASFARNHISLSTIRAYLRDGTLRHEDAATVLEMMMERGIFGFELYNLLITAFPDEFAKLPQAAQTKIMQQANLTPLQIEIETSAISSADVICKSFIEDQDETKVLTIMTHMFEMCVGQDPGKDEGISCLAALYDLPCEHPSAESCIECMCPYLIFTKYAYKPLLDVLKKYMTSAQHGDARANTILTAYLIPKYQKILNAFFKNTEMKKADRLAMKTLMEEKLNGNDDDCA